MIVLHYNYQRPRMSWIDALYFTVETMTTTGYGDFSFARPSEGDTWLRLFAATLMFSGATTIALLVAFIADVLLSQRFVLAAARPRARHLRNHIIVVWAERSLGDPRRHRSGRQRTRRRGDRARRGEPLCVRGTRT